MYVNRKPKQTACFRNGLSRFAWNVYKLLSGGGGNVLISPYSLSAALLLANLGAKGKTEAEIRTAMGLQSVTPNDVHRLYKTLQEELQSNTPGTSLVIANRLFARLGLDVVEKYVADSERFYGSRLELMDFIGKPDESRQGINQWVEKQTNNKIKDLLPKDSIDAMSVAVLVNAIYFKGKWEEPFKTESISKEDFNVSRTSTVNVDMMRAQRDMKYHRDDNLQCSGAELPYQSGNIAMVVILPDDIDGLKSLEEKLTSKTLQEFYDELHFGSSLEVALKMPRFKMELTYNMAQVLSKLGIRDLFEFDSADLGGMLKKETSAHVNDIIHKTFIEVDEEGTEAAGATAMMECDVLCTTAPGQPMAFSVDHPFLFLIRDSTTILFLGRMVTP